MDFKQIGKIISQNSSQHNNIYGGYKFDNNAVKTTKSQSMNIKVLKQNDSILLRHKLIESTTEDPAHPLSDLNQGLKGGGWISSRFSQFPQDIYIQFPQPVSLKQINIIINEKSIPSQIKFYSYIPKNSDELAKNYHELNYNYIGFIKMDTNEKSNFRAREFRKVYIDTKALYVKLELDKNYMNRFNIFNQVGLMSIEFYGDYLEPLGKNKMVNDNYLRGSIKQVNIDDDELIDTCKDKINELKAQMDLNIQLEKYEECKKIKAKLQRVRIFGKKIYDLEMQKKVAINNEDFDAAMDLKNLIDKLKVNVEKVDKMFEVNRTHQNSEVNINPNNINNNSNNLNNSGIEEQITNNQFSNVNINLQNISMEQGINESINSNNFENDKNMRSNYTLNQSNSRINQSAISKRQYDDNYMSYDDMIIPTLLKKMNNEQPEVQDEQGEIEKGELEDIEPKLMNEYKLISNVIGIEGLKKLFSKQILWKDEGVNLLLEKLVEILDTSSNTQGFNINIGLTCLMKIAMILIEEKHPGIVIKALEILKQVFIYIKEHRTKLNIDINITDSILSKIKTKLGDVNPKVRLKAIDLYCYMLTLDFCDYNNLISELLEEELRHLDSKFIPKSPNLINGKLDIFNYVFDNFNDALVSKRTDKETFPSNLVIEYLLMNVTNNKSEIRKKTRKIIKKFLNIFEAKKFKKKMEKIEERELIKLVTEIPSLRELFPKVGISSTLDTSLNSNGKSRSKSRSRSDIETNSPNKKGDSKSPKDNRNKKKATTRKSKASKLKCEHCLKEITDVQSHLVNKCVMFSKCEKCNLNIEVKKLNNHRLNECKKRKEYKMCKRCKEAINITEYDSHVKDNNCNPAKNQSSSSRCPLCHQDIGVGQEGFYNHLVVEGCPKQDK